MMIVKKQCILAALMLACLSSWGQDDNVFLTAQIAHQIDISEDDARKYMMSLNTIQKDMYNVDDDSIAILYKNGDIKDISEASELLNVQLLSKKIRKYYLCYQRFE